MSIINNTTALIARFNNVNFDDLYVKSVLNLKFNIKKFPNDQLYEIENVSSLSSDVFWQGRNYHEYNFLASTHINDFVIEKIILATNVWLDRSMYFDLDVWGHMVMYKRLMNWVTYYEIYTKADSDLLIKLTNSIIRHADHLYRLVPIVPLEDALVISSGLFNVFYALKKHVDCKDKIENCMNFVVNKSRQISQSMNSSLSVFLAYYSLRRVGIDSVLQQFPEMHMVISLLISNLQSVVHENYVSVFNSAKSVTYYITHIDEISDIKQEIHNKFFGSKYYVSNESILYRKFTFSRNQSYLLISTCKNNNGIMSIEYGISGMPIIVNNYGSCYSDCSSYQNSDIVNFAVSNLKLNKVFKERCLIEAYGVSNKQKDHYYNRSFVLSDSGIFCKEHVARDATHALSVNFRVIFHKRIVIESKTGTGVCFRFDGSDTLWEFNSLYGSLALFHEEDRSYIDIFTVTNHAVFWYLYKIK